MANGKKSKSSPQRAGLAKAALTIAKAAQGGTKVAGKKARRARNAFAGSASAPSNTSFTFVSRVARTTHIKNGIRVRHVELIGDVLASPATGAYSCTKYTLNPADSNTFNWLSSTARAYSLYKFISIKVHIKSLVGTSTNGMVGVASSPDVTDAVPSNKTSFMSYENAARCNVWQSVTHVVPQDMLKRLPAYATSSNDADQTMSKQVGALFICTQGCPASLDGLEAYIDYEVELQHPQEPGGAALFAASAASNAALFGVLGEGLGSSVAQNVGSNIKTRQRTYLGVQSAGMIEVEANGSFFVTYVVGGTSLTTAPQLEFLDGGGGELLSTAQVVTTSSTQGTCTYEIKNAPKPFYISPDFAAGGTVEYARLMIAQSFNASTDSVVTVEALASRLSKLEANLAPDSPIHIEPPTPLPSVHRRH